MKQGTFRRLLPALGLMAVALVACDQTPVSLPEATELAVTPSAVQLHVGESATASAQVLDQRGRTLRGADATWSSSNPTVATVSRDGTITARAVGSAEITAVHGGLTGTVTVDVARDDRGEIAAVQAEVSDIDLHVRGGQERIRYRAFTARGDLQCHGDYLTDVETSDASVAEAWRSGCAVIVNPIGPGDATITLTLDDQVVTFDVSVDAGDYFIRWIDSPAPLTEAYAGNTVTYRVQVVDHDDQPVANQTVHFQADRGAVATTSVQTDADGFAEVDVRMPTELRWSGAQWDWDRVRLTVRGETETGQMLFSQSRESEVGPAPAASFTIYHRDADWNWVEVGDGSVTTRTGATAAFRVVSYDEYANFRRFNHIFAEIEEEGEPNVGHSQQWDQYDGTWRWIRYLSFWAGAEEREVTLTITDTFGDADDEDTNYSESITVEISDDA
jgi:hypothetical protein